MLPLVAPSSVQPAPVAIVAPVGSAVPEPAVGRLPVNIVPASIAAQESYNQRQGAAAMRTPPNAPEESAQPLGLNSGFGFNSSVSSSTPLRFGFSSGFLAQLLGQSLPSQSSAITAFYSQGINLPLDTETWQQYAQVRYKPSDAALPPPPSARERVLLVRAALEQAQAQQARNIPAATIANVAAQSSSLEAAMANVARLPFSQPITKAAAEPAPTPSPARRSLVNGRGADAYTNTAVRNEGASVDPKPQVTFTL